MVHTFSIIVSFGTKVVKIGQAGDVGWRSREIGVDTSSFIVETQSKRLSLRNPVFK